MVTACVLIAGAGAINLAGTVITVSRLPVPDSLPPALSLLERYGVTGSQYAKVMAAIDVAYALVIMGLALLMAVTLKDKRRWARIASAVLAASALGFAVTAGTGLQVTAASLAAVGAAITFTKGASPWFRTRSSQRLQMDPA